MALIAAEAGGTPLPAHAPPLPAEVVKNAETVLQRLPASPGSVKRVQWATHSVADVLKAYGGSGGKNRQTLWYFQPFLGSPSIDV